MADIWIAVIEDRHGDPDCRPFSSEAGAVEAARAEMSRMVVHPEGILWDAEITPGMQEDGWVFLAEYAYERDRVRVVRRQLDGA